MKKRKYVEKSFKNGFNLNRRIIHRIKNQLHQAIKSAANVRYEMIRIIDTNNQKITNTLLTLDT